MASPYYVWSGASGTNDGTSWTNAYTAFSSAVTAANTDGDVILVHYTHQEELGADTTYTLTNSVHVRSVDKNSSDAPTPMGTSGWIGNSTTNYSVVIRNSAAKWLYVYGITLRNAGAGNDSVGIYTSSDTSVVTADNCYFWLGTTSISGQIALSLAAASSAGLTRAINCTFRFGATAQKIAVLGRVEITGGSLSADGTIPTDGLFTQLNSAGTAISGGFVLIEGMDLSALAANELVDNHSAAPVTYQFVNCKLGSGFTINESETVYSNDVSIFNCSSGDEHYQFFHCNALGTTSVSTGIYATDAAANNKFDGTNRCSWKIVTTAQANYYAPYISPWFETYHSGTSAITPSVEILRDGSSTAYQDDEVWGEWSYQGTSGVPLASFVNDRMALNGTPANQTTGALSASNWTGENATAWFGKLAPASTITPAEIGMLRARVCVGEPSITVYVDPTVRYA